MKQPLLAGTKHAPPPIVKPEDVQISKGVPYPARRARITPKWEPLLKSMAVGDCIKFDTERDSKVVMGACSAIRLAAILISRPCWTTKSNHSPGQPGRAVRGGRAQR